MLIKPAWTDMLSGNVNVDEILRQFNASRVDYILIGGMNFLLRHVPELTFDVDLWVRDTDLNLERTNRALQNLGGEWGPTEQQWQAIPDDPGWLKSQAIFCLTTHHGAVDIFREVRGLESRYDECAKAAASTETAAGVHYSSLSNEHMLACQEALPPGERKERRMQILREAIRRERNL